MLISQLLRHKDPEVATIDGSASVRSALALLAAKGIGALVVSSDGRRVDGIVSERDIVRALGRHGTALLPMPLTEIMTQHVETSTLDESVSHAMARMTAGRYRHLPVVDNGAIVGLVSIGDLVKNRVREMELEVGILRDRAIAHL